MPKAAAKESQAQPASYEEALAELEQLVSRLESGQLPLDQLLSGYQRGAVLLAFCQERLQAVEDQRTQRNPKNPVGYLATQRNPEKPLMIMVMLM